MARDLYETLNLNRNASKDDIKRSYRKLARQYHPDVNKDPGAEDMFKEISRAYEVLSDDEKRARYDRFGEAGIGGNGMEGGPDFAGAGFNDISDIFESFFGGFAGGATGGRRGGRSGGPTRGDDLRYDMVLEFTEAVFGCEKEINIAHLVTCETCRGSGAKPGAGHTTCRNCGGQGQIRQARRTPFGLFTQVVPCPVCMGRGEVIENPCPTCDGRGRNQKQTSIKINIPAGVDGGSKLRVQSEGDAGERGGPPGDLFIYIGVRNHPIFRREGQDIYSSAQISYLQAILGSEMTVETVDGPHTVVVPPGTQPETVLTLDGRGVPRVGNPNRRGNHYLQLKVAIPTKLSADERELLTKIAKVRGEKVSKKEGLEGLIDSIGNLFH
ncbi:molecular chaperone DnaJ [Gloeobacter kilaueensis]|uniref:Chaperone protein DnaJ n=1 Tax=Gloeobacter kilaueensis (strain ATCC BAA-2537 / CCAP 1431/1 / ULC 316 / JS1) TaxID=1183438 RepID=U5QHU6_GLOK1|nr:molecular chaperone DnaJ [Gloeobacter kilaueensis]AGY57199.1 chaperone protein DnaJ [Gloeobacter kilaueensis JS1]